MRIQPVSAQRQTSRPSKAALPTAVSPAARQSSRASVDCEPSTEQKKVDKAQRPPKLLSPLAQVLTRSILIGSIAAGAQLVSLPLDYVQHGVSVGQPTAMCYARQRRSNSVADVANAPRGAADYTSSRNNMQENSQQRRQQQNQHSGLSESPLSTTPFSSSRAPEFSKSLSRLPLTERARQATH